MKHNQCPIPPTELRHEWILWGFRTDYFQQQGSLSLGKTQTVLFFGTRPGLGLLRLSTLFELPALRGQKWPALVFGAVKDRLETPKHELNEIMVASFRIVRNDSPSAIGSP